MSATSCILNEMQMPVLHNAKLINYHFKMVRPMIEGFSEVNKLARSLITLTHAPYSVPLWSNNKWTRQSKAGLLFSRVRCNHTAVRYKDTSRGCPHTAPGVALPWGPCPNYTLCHQPPPVVIREIMHKSKPDNSCIRNQNKVKVLHQKP